MMNPFDNIINLNMTGSNAAMIKLPEAFAVGGASGGQPNDNEATGRIQ